MPFRCGILLQFVNILQQVLIRLRDLRLNVVEIREREQTARYKRRIQRNQKCKGHWLMCHKSFLLSFRIRWLLKDPCLLHAETHKVQEQIHNELEDRLNSRTVSKGH